MLLDATAGVITHSPSPRYIVLHTLCQAQVASLHPPEQLSTHTLMAFWLIVPQWTGGQANRVHPKINHAQVLLSAMLLSCPDTRTRPPTLPHPTLPLSALRPPAQKVAHPQLTNDENSSEMRGGRNEALPVHRCSFRYMSTAYIVPFPLVKHVAVWHLRAYRMGFLS